MSEKKFFEQQGFQLADEAQPYFELWYKKFSADSPVPQFKECCKAGECDNTEGITIFYSDACPFTNYYVKEIEELSIERGFLLRTKKIENIEQAQNHFVPFTIYSVFQNGKFITQHILNKKYFDKFIKEL